MAKFNSTTFGAISGRHGSAVAATTKDGKNYLRVYRAPSNPNSDKQIAHRTKFSFAIKSLGCFRNLFKETYNNSRGMNMGVSHAIKNAIIGESPDYSIDYSRLVFTKGNVNQAVNPVITVDNLTANLNWDYVEAVNSKPQDSVNAIFFNEDTQLSIHLKELGFRSDKVGTYNLPEVWKGSTVYCWIYFTAKNNTTISSSESQFVSSFEF